MVTDRLPSDAGIPDLHNLLFKSPGTPLTIEDFGCLLRVYLREVNRVTFLILCGAGYLTEALARLLPRGVTLHGAPLGVGLSFTVTPTGNGHTPVHLTIAQCVGSATLMVLEHTPGEPHATARALTEEGYFRFMETLGVEPAHALRLVHDTIWTAAVAETPDRVEPLATRLEAIGALITAEYARHGLTW